MSDTSRPAADSVGDSVLRHARYASAPQRTMCGAEPTHMDVLNRTARSTPEWVTCPQCADRCIGDENKVILSSYLDTIGALRRALSGFADDMPIRGDLTLAITLDLDRGSFVTARASGGDH